MKTWMHSRCALALSLLLALSGCESAPGPIDGPADGGPAAKGRVAVHTASVGLPVLVSDVSLSLGALEATSDREPGDAARVPLASLGLDAATTTSLMSAPPATYGAVRFVALDALSITTTTGLVLRVEFGDATALELRCAGPGAYLPLGGEIDLFVELDFPSLQSALAFEGLYPPTLPLRTVTDPTIVAAVLDALGDALLIDCGG